MMADSRRAIASGEAALITAVGPTGVAANVNEDSPDYELNEEEKKFCAAYYSACKQFRSDAVAATRMMEMTHTGQDGQVDNTKANAFKHSLWTALMTTSAGGTTLGQTFSLAHEDHQYDLSRNTRRRRMSRMDIINNRVGYWVGKNAFGTDEKAARISACRTLVSRMRTGKKIGGKLDPFDEYKRLGFGSSSFEKSPTEVISTLIWRRSRAKTGMKVKQYSKPARRCEGI